MLRSGEILLANHSIAVYCNWIVSDTKGSLVKTAKSKFLEALLFCLCVRHPPPPPPQLIFLLFLEVEVKFCLVGWLAYLSNSLCLAWETLSFQISWLISFILLLLVQTRNYYKVYKPLLLEYMVNFYATAWWVLSVAWLGSCARWKILVFLS